MRSFFKSLEKSGNFIRTGKLPVATVCMSDCVCSECDGDRGQGTGRMLHHASQQNACQASAQLLGHDAQTEGLFSSFPMITLSTGDGSSVE